MPPKRAASKAAAKSSKPSSATAAGSKRAAASSSSSTAPAKKKKSVAPGSLTATPAREYPASFQCTSGYLLWGHLHTIWTGSTANRADSMLGEPEYAEGGTIASQLHQYRTQARRGRWLVERLFKNDEHVGCIAHHEDVTAKELLLGAAELSDAGWPADQIQRVGRYDWSHAYDGVPTAEMVATLKRDRGTRGADDEEEDEAQEEYLEALRSGRCILLDADRFADFKSLLARRPRQLTQDGVCLFDDAEDNVGCCYTPLGTEYEFAWMCYAEDGEELVGFVYDAAYTLLENFDGDMSVEDTVIIREDGTAVD
ncbi:hypothetical protein HDU87_008636 [Geranomyces variabilis]|uniref:Uncharacterized protein n=1 Tax=Geranomyces variabilis TaxID=109894 RepID=A0AAD5TF74_9FUNG|nr:hypothetical protein HDU87_008636 [Geranomyces variabilis]